MDFYFQGMVSQVTATETGFAEKWHPQLLQELPDIQLTLLIGQYAQAYYLKEKVSGKVRTGQPLPELLCQPITH